MAEPVLLLVTVVVAGAPLVLLPGPVGILLAVGVAAALMWLDHRLQESVKRLPVRSGSESMPGQSAVVLEPLDPAGTVRCAGEEWRAIDLLGRPVAQGAIVRVVRVRGLQLEVEPVEDGA